MTEVKGHECYAHFRGRNGNGTCDTECQWYREGNPCIMWIPKRLWKTNLCDVCIYENEKCNVGLIRSLDDGHIMACFGFEEAQK